MTLSVVVVGDNEINGDGGTLRAQGNWSWGGKRVGELEWGVRLQDIRQHIAAVSSFIYDNNAPFISRVRPRIERDQSTKLLWGVGGI